jgi:hypothetical protein
MNYEGEDRIKALLAITQKLELGLASKSRKRRTWTAVKAVFGEEKIKQIKTTLILARQVEIGYVIFDGDWGD